MKPTDGSRNDGDLMRNRDANAGGERSSVDNIGDKDCRIIDLKVTFPVQSIPKTLAAQNENSRNQYVSPSIKDLQLQRSPGKSSSLS